MSLRLRLLLAAGGVALIALVSADVATYHALRSFLYQRVDQQLDTAHMSLEARLNSDSGGPRFGPGGNGPDRDGTADTLAPGVFVEVRDAAGNISGTPVPAHQTGGSQLTPRLPSRITGLSTSGPGEPHAYLTVPASEVGGASFRVRVSALQDGGQLIVGLPLQDATATLHRLLAVELAVTAVALLVALALGWWSVRLGLRPLAEVKETAGAIADGQLDRRVPGADQGTEVGEVARALNTMLGRIEQAFAERDATEAELRRSEELLRRFVADASHELRTPLSAVAAYAEMFDRGVSTRPADLARVMAGIRTETGRMSHLVADLLLLARLDEGQPLERKPVELVALTAEAVETARAVGPDWPVRLSAERPVEVQGDPLRLRQVLDNLLSNVRAHTPPGTSTRVTVREGDAEAVIEVSDDGPGLTEEQARRVFERFYRVDPSRSRPHGGAGLGLGIAAAIVAAHQGQVSASSTPGGGATFTVRLPRPGPMPEPGPAASEPGETDRTPAGAGSRQWQR
jgi:two-component system, OmpR family, sensor kinase